MSTYPKKDIDIPQNKDVDIRSKNNNQSSVHLRVPRNKVFNQLFNSDTVKDHVSTNNKDVIIPKKGCRHTQKKISTYLKIKMWTYVPRIIINHQFMLKFLLTKYIINYSIVFVIEIQCQHTMMDVNV